MSNDQDLYQEGIKSPEINSDPESDFDSLGSDEIIELTDVVNEEKDPLESDVGELLLLDEEKPDHHPAEPTDDVTFEDMDPLSGLESSDFKFENSTAFGGVDTEALPEPSHERLDDVLADLQTEASALEKPEDILADLEKDEPEDQETSMEQPDEFLSGHESPDEAEKPEDVPAFPEEKHKDYEKPEELADPHDIPGISEEKMKALLTEVIQETVDKAVRETVSEVAEKVIREAIEGLKQSIASSEEV
jgi:hypothetical protein